MANVGFTRDEVILALDVLYFSGEKYLSPKSKAIVELSKILNQLPIHPVAKRPENFRNSTGVSHQIDRFRRGYSADGKAWHVNTLFFQIADEFAHDLDQLHNIAQAIRRNAPYFESVPFGSALEQDDFPEGALLGHLHRLLEQRDGKKVPCGERCAICQLEPEIIYQPCDSILQNHLTVHPIQMDGGVKYTSTEFITVCPNCHAALHRYRPWLGKENCENLLR
mgnify:CR=1 FL=1